ncbi:hypothetical protein GPJ56_004314 [Histomonas meleagridis]|uniref:uncharacterized protein n=1 Tax=Histomonas meleagridis TaxID=135588 RepID=UPI00355975DC|nr:hypothetical protein GPJ56_004314 [Histomonas meleagridis]KAH0800471.1 hypothetical protein GO595_006674 [Histomonas meleagridis]
MPKNCTEEEYIDIIGKLGIFADYFIPVEEVEHTQQQNNTKTSEKFIRERDDVFSDVASMTIPISNLMLSDESDVDVDHPNDDVILSDNAVENEVVNDENEEFNDAQEFFNF